MMKRLKQNKMLNLILKSLLGLVLGISVSLVVLADNKANNRNFSLAVQPGKSNIYIYRDQSLGIIRRIEFTVNGKSVGTLGTDTYTLISVEPGEHVIMGKEDEHKNKFTLTTFPNVNYYIQTQVLNDEIMIRRVPEDKGLEGLAECTLVKSKGRK